MSETLEQQARDLMERCGCVNAQELSAGDVVELANLLNRPADRPTLARVQKEFAGLPTEQQGFAGLPASEHPTSAPTLARVPLQGTWGEHDLRRAFVEGAKWWEWRKTNATMWPADVDLAEAKAQYVYGAERDALAAQLDQRMAEREGLLRMVDAVEHELALVAAEAISERAAHHANGPTTTPSAEWWEKRAGWWQKQSEQVQGERDALAQQLADLQAVARGADGVLALQRDRLDRLRAERDALAQQLQQAKDELRIVCEGAARVEMARDGMVAPEERDQWKRAAEKAEAELQQVKAERDEALTTGETLAQRLKELADKFEVLLQQK